MELTLRPTRKQHEAYGYLWDQKTRYPLFGGGAGGGKSWMGCEWLLVCCYRFSGFKGFIGRKELKRLMSSTYITFLKVCKHHQIPDEHWQLNSKYNYIEFLNGSRIDLLDVDLKPSDPMFERFGSLEYTAGWLEEAGEIDELAFDVLKSRVNRHMNDDFGFIGKVLLTCNPTKNWLKKRFYNPWKAGILEDHKAFIQSLYTDNPYTSKSYKDTLGDIRNEAIRQRLMDGDWNYEDTGSVFRGLDKCIKGELKPAQREHAYVMGVDLAKYQDWTVLTVIDLVAFEVVAFERFNKIDWEFQRERIKTLANKYQAGVVVDATGVGDPVAESLKRDGVLVKEYKYTQASKKYLIENLVLKIERNEITFPDIPELVEELRNFTFEYLPSGTIRYNAPSGMHDDCVNSLALAVYGAGHYRYDELVIKDPFPDGSLGELYMRIEVDEMAKDLDHFV